MEKKPKIVTGSFFTRFVAFLFEHLLIVGVPGALLFTYAPQKFYSIIEFYNEVPYWFLPFIYHGYLFVFNFFFLFKYETTLGKFLFNLKIRSEDNKKLSILQMIDRELIGKPLSELVFYVGYIIAAFRKDTKAIHDILAKTIVVNSKETIQTSSPIKLSFLSIVSQSLILIVTLKFAEDFKNRMYPKTSNDVVLIPGPNDQAIFNNKYTERKEEAEAKMRENDLKDIIRAATNGSLEMSKIKKLEYLLQEDIQIAIINTQPIFLKQWPRDIPFTKNAIKAGVETIYKFDSFLPEHTSDLEEIKQATLENQNNYSLHFIKFLQEAKPARMIKTRKAIHPDFFTDKDFTYTSVNECLFRDPTYDYLRTFEYNEEVQQNFKDSALKSQRAITLECLPEIIKKDNDFLVHLAKGSFSVEDLMKVSSDPRLFEVKVNQALQSLPNRLRDTPSQVNSIPQDVQDSAVFQHNILSKYPLSIKYMNEHTVLSKDVFQDFIKNTYNPSRFFSDYQKSISPIKELLSEHKNDSKDFLQKYRQDSLEKLKDQSRWMGNSGNSEQTHFVLSLPKEIIDDDNFQIEVINSIKGSPEFYLNILTQVKEISNPVKQFMINDCRVNKKYRSMTFDKGYAPSYIKSDELFFMALSNSCNENLQEKSPTPQQVVNKKKIEEEVNIAREKALRESEASREASMKKFMEVQERYRRRVNEEFHGTSSSRGGSK